VTRRGAVAGAALLAAAGPARGRTPTPTRAFVLVHGAWHGGWCWRDVADRLRGRGHRVFAPTLSGMGERLHLSAPDVGVSVHARDIAAVIEAEELEDVTLVLHSYAGLPGSVAADRTAERVARIVYLDAVFPVPDEALTANAPPEAIEAARASLIDGHRLPSFPPQAFGVTEPAQVAWLGRRLTTIPWKALTETLPALGPGFARLPKHYVAATRNTLPDSRRAVDLARAAGWTMHELDAGHDAMITAPRETADLLRRIAG